MDYYKEMLELIIQARLESGKVDEWKKALYIKTPASTTDNYANNRTQFYRDYL